jgi:hypothetical protein
MTTWSVNEYRGYRNDQDTAYVGQPWSGDYYAVWARDADGAWALVADGFASADDGKAYGEKSGGGGDGGVDRESWTSGSRGASTRQGGSRRRVSCPSSYDRIIVRISI